MPQPVDMTADGRHIYVNMRGFDMQSVMEVERNPTTGSLTPAQPPGGCAKYPGSRDNSTPGCGSQAKALSDSFDVALSPTGKYLYSAG